MRRRSHCADADPIGWLAAGIDPARAMLSRHIRRPPRVGPPSRLAPPPDTVLDPAYVPAVSPAPDRRHPSKAQIPIEPASPLALPQPRFRAWALLGRRLDGVRGTITATASEKPAPELSFTESLAQRAEGRGPSNFHV